MARCSWRNNINKFLLCGIGLIAEQLLCTGVHTETRMANMLIDKC